MAKKEEEEEEAIANDQTPITAMIIKNLKISLGSNKILTIVGAQLIGLHGTTIASLFMTCGELSSRNKDGK